MRAAALRQEAHRMERAAAALRTVAAREAEAREKGREDAWQDVGAEIAATGFKCRKHGGQALLCFLAHHARLRRKVVRYIGRARLYMWECAALLQDEGAREHVQALHAVLGKEGA